MLSNSAEHDHHSAECEESKEANASAPSRQQTSERAVSKWLGKTLRVELVDGRSVRGQLALTDNAPNLVLAHSDEWWNDDCASRRSVGMVVVAAHAIRTIYECSTSITPSNCK